MPILKKVDIIEKGPYLKQLNEELIVAEKNTEKLIATNKALQQSYKDLKKTNDGTEAKKLVAVTDKLTTSTKKLKKAKSDSQIVAEKLVKENKKLNQTYTPQAKALAVVRQKTLEQNKALREQAKATLGVQKKTGGLIRSFKNLGAQMLGALGIIGVILRLVQVVTDGAQRFDDLTKSSNRLKNTFNITTKQAKKLAIQINAISNNFKDVDSQNLEESLTAIVKTFKDITEQEALDLIQEGFQKGSNNSGEFLDILKEYPVQFKAAGIDAKTMFAIINQQVKQGIYSDKGVDTIKEGGLRLRENTKAVKEALKPLDESVRLQIKQEIAAGNSFKAIQLVSEALKDTSLTAEETQTIIADVFGGAGEDAGIEYIKTLADIETNLDNVSKQTSINEDANFRLSKSYNAFILSVSEGDGVISSAFANVKDGFASFLEGMQKINAESFGTKMKVVANGFISIVNAISFGGLDKALKNITQSEEAWRFNTDRATSSLKIQKTEIDKNEKSVGRLTTAEEEVTVEIKKTTKELAKEEKERKKAIAALKKHNAELEKEKKIRASFGTFREEGDVSRGDDQTTDPVLIAQGQDASIEANNKLHNDRLLAQDKILNDKKIANAKRSEQNIAQARKTIADAAFTAAAQIATDIFAAGQEAKLAKLQEANEIESTQIQAQADADKEIQRQRLEEGLITEAEFKAESLKIDEKTREKEKALDLKFRIAKAKSDKKTALFEIAINTAIGIIKTIASVGPLFAPPFIAALVAVAAIQSAAVLAKPLPKFEKGEVDIKGLSHDKGGINANIEGGESVITRLGTSNAPEALQAINDGLIKDSDIIEAKNYNNYDRSILSLNGLSNKFDENNALTRQSNEYLRNSFSVYHNNGKIYKLDSNGKMSEIIIRDA